MDKDLIEYLRKRIEKEHVVVTKFTEATGLTFPCCPKCTNSFSVGRLLDDDCYLENVSMWLRYKKCANCGWRIEIGKYRRFNKPTKRHRRSRGGEETASRPDARSTNKVDRFDWGTPVDRNLAISA